MLSSRSFAAGRRRALKRRLHKPRPSRVAENAALAFLGTGAALLLAWHALLFFFPHCLAGK